MTCWVAPTLAAELWGTSVEDILQRIIAGELKSREDGGFLFIDVNAPRLRAADRPPTYKLADFIGVEPNLTAVEDEAPLNFRSARARANRVRPRAA